jgi:hypothetical protein
MPAEGLRSRVLAKAGSLTACSRDRALTGATGLVRRQDAFSRREVAPAGFPLELMPVHIVERVGESGGTVRKDLVHVRETLDGREEGRTARGDVPQGSINERRNNTEAKAG